MHSNKLFVCCKHICDFVKITNFKEGTLPDLSVSGSTKPVKSIDQRDVKMKCIRSDKELCKTK